MKLGRGLVMCVCVCERVTEVCLSRLGCSERESCRRRNRGCCRNTSEFRKRSSSTRNSSEG